MHESARQMTRALDVEDDLRPGTLLQDAARKQHHLPVGEDDAATLGNDAEPITVAVERKPDLGVGFAQQRIRSCRFSG